MIKLKGKNVAGNKHLQTLLRPVETAADNLLQEKTIINKPLTDESLIDILTEGEFIYWELARDEDGNILKVKPYSRDVFYRKLMKQRKRKLDDVMYDFYERQRV